MKSTRQIDETKSFEAKSFLNPSTHRNNHENILAGLEQLNNDEDFQNLP